jgi:hypothetical protein
VFRPGFLVLPGQEKVSGTVFEQRQ